MERKNLSMKRVKNSSCSVLVKADDRYRLVRSSRVGLLEKIDEFEDAGYEWEVLTPFLTKCLTELFGG